MSSSAVRTLGDEIEQLVVDSLATAKAIQSEGTGAGSVTDVVAALNVAAPLVKELRRQAYIDGTPATMSGLTPAATEGSTAARSGAILSKLETAVRKLGTIGAQYGHGIPDVHLPSATNAVIEARNAAERYRAAVTTT